MLWSQEQVDKVLFAEQIGELRKQPWKRDVDHRKTEDQSDRETDIENV